MCVHVTRHEGEIEQRTNGDRVIQGLGTGLGITGKKRKRKHVHSERERERKHVIAIMTAYVVKERQ